MKTIYHVVLEGSGEAEAFFDEAFNELAYWAMNDAHWRQEYMNPLLNSLGYDVVRVHESDYDVVEVVDADGYVVDTEIVDPEGLGFGHLVQKTLSLFR